MKRIISFLIIFLLGCMGYLLGLPGSVSAYGLKNVPSIVYSQPGDIQVNNPETSQAFYDSLTGKPRDYFVNSEKDFELYINLMVPEIANRNGRYSARIFSVSQDKTEQIAELDGGSSDWQEFYDPSIRDYYLKGPELSKQVPAGGYKIEVYSKDNQGEYVLVIGKKESYDIKSVLNIYWQFPALKTTFFKTSVLQFFFTPFGIAGIGVIGAVLILLALIFYLSGLIREIVKHNEAKTLLLTSNGMQMKDEIVKLLQKPAYDVTVAFISTAAKPQENLDYMKKDWDIMRDELGFNVEEVDIDGKTENQVMKLLELKDIIFVEGGNTFYLLNAMRKCNFEKVMRKLLKEGKVYIGASAGSIVAGRTIEPAVWRDEVRNKNKNFIKLRNLKGLNLVPFDIVVHYDRNPEIAEIIKQKIKNQKKRAKNLKILTDDQAILVQGSEVSLIGEGEQVVI